MMDFMRDSVIVGLLCFIAALPVCLYAKYGGGLVAFAISAHGRDSNHVYG